MFLAPWVHAVRMTILSTTICTEANCFVCSVKLDRTGNFFFQMPSIIIADKLYKENVLSYSTCTCTTTVYFGVVQLRDGESEVV